MASPCDPPPPVLPFPVPGADRRPHGWRDYEEEAAFDPAEHLAAALPRTADEVQRVWMRDVPGCAPDDQSIAYTSVFPVLSAAGLAQLRAVVERERLGGHVRRTERIQQNLRATAYRSRWWRDLCTCERLTRLASDLAGQPLLLSSMHSNLGHINIGAPARRVSKATAAAAGGGSDAGCAANEGAQGTGGHEPDGKRAIDSWHVDSVGFVLVVLCTEMEGAEGGQLEVAVSEHTAALQAIRAGELAPERVLRVPFSRAGDGVFMQGSRLAHHVAPLLSHCADRISFVLSFIAADPFAPDTTRLQTYTINSTRELAHWEYSLHQAWRASQQLQHYVRSQPWSEDRAALARPLREVAQELLRQCDLIEGRVEDEVLYVLE